MALSQTRADKIKKPGRYGDGRNVYLRVMEGGSRSWIFRYELRGRERVMGLGPCADFTLEEARERARLARQLLKDGIDPLAKAHEARAQVARAAAKSIKFAQAADAYYKFHAAKWTNDRYKKLLLTRLNEYAGIPPRWTLPDTPDMTSVCPHCTALACWSPSIRWRWSRIATAIGDLHPWAVWPPPI